MKPQRTVVPVFLPRPPTLLAAATLLLGTLAPTSSLAAERNPHARTEKETRIRVSDDFSDVGIRLHAAEVGKHIGLSDELQGKSAGGFRNYWFENQLTEQGGRYLNPRVGGWLSPDPDWLSQGPMGLNSYQHVFWNPLRFADPDGRAPVIVAGGNLQASGTIRDEKGKEIPFRVDDVRRLKGFDDAVRQLAQRKYAKDVTAKTPVIAVDRTSEMKRELEESGEGGSKVYIGHSELEKDERTGDLIATGLDPNGMNAGTKMSGQQFGDVTEALKGDPVALMCSGGSLNVSGPGEKPKTAKGPKASKQLTAFTYTLDWAPGAREKVSQGKEKFDAEKHLVVKAVKIKGDDE